MMKKLTKRLTGIIMTLAMVVSLLPAMTLPAKAAELMAVDFETTTGYTVTGIIAPASAACWDRTDGTVITPDVPFSGQHGTYYFYAENTDSPLNNSAPVYVTLDSINVSGQTNLQLKLLVAGNSHVSSGYEVGDYLQIQYSVDSGAFIPLAQFIPSIVDIAYLTEDANVDGTTDGVNLSPAFTEFTYSIPATGTSLQIRIMANINQGSEEVGFDNIRILGTLDTGPTLTSAAYNADTNVLSVTGTNMTTGDTIDVSKLTLTGQGGTYTLAGSYTVTASNATSFSITLNGTDQACVETLLNKNGTSSIGGTTYNLAAAANWDVTKSAPADLTGNGITVTNANPSAVFDYESGVTGYESKMVIQTDPRGSGEQLKAVSVNDTMDKYSVIIPNGPIAGNESLVSSANFMGELSVTFSLVSGKSFDLTAISFGEFGAQAETVTLTANNSNTVTLNVVAGTNPTNPQVFALTGADATNMKGITSFTVTATSSSMQFGAADLYGLGFDDIVLANIVTTNAAPTVNSVNPATITYTDTVANDTFTNTTGTLSATDTDGTIASYGISGGTVGSTDIGGIVYDVSKGGTYGTLYVVSTGVNIGKYAFVPNDTVINAVFANSSEPFTVTATDNLGASGNATLTVSIIGVNDTPSDIALTGNTVNQSGGANAVVGTLSTTDRDSGQTHTYSLVSGTGDDNNTSFNFSGTSLRANNASALAAGTYSVRVRTTDSGSATYEEAFTITVTDNVAPTVTSVGVPANATYGTAQNLDFTVNFAEAVTVVTTGGTPRIALTIGASTQFAYYLSGSATTALVFRYTVQIGDNDSDGITVGALAANGGTLRDAAGNDATLTLDSVGSTASVKVDAVAPSTPTLAISVDTGTPGNDGVTKTASQTITVSGENTSAVNVDFGDGPPHATGTVAGGTFTTAAHTYAAGKYTISVTLTDTLGNVSAAGTKTVVIDTAAPSITTSTDQYISVSAATNGATICTLAATDATNIPGFTDAATWTITGGLDSGYFFITGTSLKINSALGEGTYMVAVSVTDTAGNTGAILLAVHAVNGPTVGVVDKTYTDTAANDTFVNQSGTISATSTTGSITGYGIDGVITDGSYLAGAYDRSKAGTYGTLYVNKTTGAYAYVPSGDAAFNALTATVNDSFTIWASDTIGTTYSTLTITINGVNDTPTLTAPTSGSYTDTTAADSFSNTTGTLSGGDRDTAASLTYGILGGTTGGSTDIGGTTYDVSRAGTYGTLYVVSTGADRGKYVYDPSDSAINAVTANQSDTFTVTVSDGALSASQTYTVSITSANDSPTLNANNGRTLDEGASTTITTIQLLFNDVDTAATSLTFTVGTAPAHGTLYKSGVALSVAGTFTQNDITNNRITYTHNGSEPAPESFTFTVSDGTTTLPIATFHITVTPVNDAPVISSAGTASFTAGGTGTAYTSAASDPEGSALTWSITAGADAARFDINSSTGAVTFKIAPSYSAPVDSDTNNIYQLTVSVTDGALTDTQAITITVTDAPPTGGGTSTDTGTDVEVNGQTYSAGSTDTATDSSGQTTTTVTVDSNKLGDILNQQGQGATVTIPVTNGADVAAASLSGDLMNALQDNGATLVIQTASASYSLPANDLDMNTIAQQFGSNVDPAQVAINVSIAEPSSATVTVVADAATDGGFTIMVPAVNFSVTASYNGQTTTVDAFNSYVQRTVAIPDGVDPSKITTGVVVDPDGTTHHVPTRVIVIDGKYYAVINSLTNSTYTVIWHPIEFDDVTTSWAKNAINDMGSRMVVMGIDGKNYEPNRDITRAEFAAIVVRALGLEQGMGTSKFSDVKSSDWYFGYIETASGYGLIKGYDDGSFRPNGKITRQEAMAIIARAMMVTKLNPSLTDSQVTALLAPFTDNASASGWANTGIAACLKTGVITGRTSTTLSPTANITRAEVAVIVQRLLQKSGLI